jgi:hypothetical protein
MAKLEGGKLFAAPEDMDLIERFVDVARARLARSLMTHGDVHIMLVELFALTMQGERDLALALVKRTLARWEAEAAGPNFVILDDHSQITRH